MGVLEKLTDPVWHYLLKGWKMGLNPSPRFDTNFYISHNNDVQSAELNPLFHFVEYGAPERRASIRPGKILADETLIEGSLLRVFKEKPLRKRITLVVDDKTPSHPVLGDLGTIRLAHEIAFGLEASLRIVSLRTNPTEQSVPGLTLEWLSVNKASQYKDIPYTAGELWIATSWSSVKSLLPHSKAFTLVSLTLGCELCLSTAGIGRLYSSEILNDSTIPSFVADHELAEHLHVHHQIEVDKHRVFSSKTLLSKAGPRLTRKTGKRVLSFLATPHLEHTLFSRGVEVLELALATGVLSEEDWVVRFFGSEIPSLNLLNSVVVVPEKIKDHTAYSAILQDSDIILALDATGITSPVARDAFEAGAQAVTNGPRRHTVKEILSDLRKAVEQSKQKVTMNPSRSQHPDQGTGFHAVLQQIKKLLSNA
jgi:hypothetical protein